MPTDAKKSAYTMSRKEAADRLNVSVSMIRKHEMAGDLHVEKRDGEVYLDADEVETLAAIRGELSGDRQLLGRLMSHVETLMRTRSQTVDELREQLRDTQKELRVRDEKIAELQGKTTEVLKTLEEVHRERVRLEMEREKENAARQRDAQVVEVVREGVRSAKLLVPAIATRIAKGRLPTVGADPRVQGLLALAADLRPEQLQALAGVLDTDQRTLLFALIEDLQPSSTTTEGP